MPHRDTYLLQPASTLLNELDIGESAPPEHQSCELLGTGIEGLLGCASRSTYVVVDQHERDVVPVLGLSTLPRCCTLRQNEPGHADDHLLLCTIGRSDKSALAAIPCCETLCLDG